MSGTTATRPMVRAHGHRATRPLRSHGRSLAGRVLRTEVLRTGPAAFAAVVVVAGAALIATRLVPAAGWHVTFAGALVWVDNTHYFWGPLAAALGAWAGGRERRRGMGELLAATSRPAWQRVHLTWTAVVLGVVAGTGAQAVLVVASGLPNTSYRGGRWLATLAVLVLGVVLYAAVGFAVGRAVPGRLVAPVVGLVGFLCINLVGASSAVRRMWPVGGLFLSDGEQVRAEILGLLAVWLLGLIGAAVLLALGRRRGLAVVPLGLAVIAAVPLVATSGSDTDPWTVADPAAQALVCTTDAGPQVCVPRMHAGLLEAVTPLAREQMAEAAPLVAWSSAREPVLGRDLPAPDVLDLSELDGAGNLFRAGLADPRGYLERSVAFQSTSGCFPAADPAAQVDQDAVTDVADTVARALQTDSTQELAAVAGADELHRRLVADPAAAKTWMDGYLVAAPDCDLPALTRLVGA